MKPSYVSVCGVVSSAQYLAVRRLWPEDSTRVLAIGLLVGAGRNAARRVADAGVEPILTAAQGALTILHVQGPVEQAELVLGAIHGTPGRFGVQLNTVWPDPVSVRALASKWAPTRLVLQVGSRALALAGSSLRERLLGYEGAVSDVLLDPSGGAGRRFDPQAIAELLQTLDELPFGLGVAGGLDGQCGPALDVVFSVRPTLSVDAEGRLRTDRDELDLAKVEAYLAAVAGADRRAPLLAEQAARSDSGSAS